MFIVGLIMKKNVFWGQRLITYLRLWWTPIFFCVFKFQDVKFSKNTALFYILPRNIYNMYCALIPRLRRLNRGRCWLKSVSQDKRKRPAVEGSSTAWLTIQIHIRHFKCLISFEGWGLDKKAWIMVIIDKCNKNEF